MGCRCHGPLARAAGIPYGTLDLLVLKTLARGSAIHGLQIADFIRDTTESVLNVEEGSLYLALQRLLMQGWVTVAWGEDERKPPRPLIHVDQVGQESARA